MASKNIQISLLNDSDIDEINNFYNYIYKAKRQREHFIWEFYNAPAGKAIYVVAKDFDTQKIVGTQCAIPIELITEKGHTVLTAKSEDTLVHPDYRGLNIFENMYQVLLQKCKENGIKYIWGFTTAKKPFLKFGFTIPYDHSQSLMVFNILSSYKYLSRLNQKNSFVSLTKIAVMCFISRVISLKRYSVSEKSFAQKISYSESGKAILTEYTHFNSKTSFNGFWIKQDLPYLKWRIEDNPYHEKIYNVYFSNQYDVVANLIFNHHKNGIWYLINSTYSNTLTEKQKASIHNKAIKLLRNSENKSVKLIRTWDFTHNEIGRREIEMRKKLGYFYINRGLSFVWKSLDENETLNVTDFVLSRIATQGNI